MTDTPTDIPAVTTNLYNLLQPLQSEERKRVIKAALTMLGDDTSVVKQKSEKGDADDDGDSDLPVKARQWMKKYDVTQEHLDHVFHVQNGAAEVIAHEAPGSSMKAKTINAYVLTGISQLLATGEATFDDESARAVCKSMGCFDKNNHSKFMKEKGNVLGGSKGSGWTLTGPGYLKSGADNAICIGVAAFAAYAGAGPRLIVVSASNSILYWAAGRGLYRSMVHSDDPRPVTEHREAVDKLDSRTDWASTVTRAPSTDKRRLRKIALSLAIVGALAAPFVFGTYKSRPTYSVMVPLTEQERAYRADYLQKRNGCRRETEAVAIVFCHMYEEEYELGRTIEYHPDLIKFLVLNFGVALAAFVGAFGLTLLVPMLARASVFLIQSYWKWLNA